MVSVNLQSVTKRFDRVTAVNGVTLQVERGELFFLLGPSGCGKTTLLRIIAGFCDATQGQVLFDDRDVTSLPAHKRNTGMVFQNYALWPHMTVEENVAYGLDVRKTPAAERKRRVAEALDMVRMAEYASRRPTQLSGGQQQRVALARAIVIQPDVLLLDEPLSNLDAKLRNEMRDEIRRVHRQTGLTAIYVTHDQKEALSLAGRMAVLRDGRVEQSGPPREVYDRPANAFVAQFIGQTNLIEGEITGAAKDGLWEVRTLHGVVRAAQKDSFQPGDRVILSIRPEAARLGAPAPGLNALPARLADTTYLGEQEQVTVTLEPNASPFRLLRLTAEGPAQGSHVLFPPATARVLRQ